MHRPGIITWPLLTSNLHRIREYLLLYDELWVPGFDGGPPTPEEIELDKISPESVAAFSALAAEGFIRTPRIDIRGAQSDEVVHALERVLQKSEAAIKKSYRTPEQAALETVAALFNIDIAFSRLTAYLSWRDEQKAVYPVAFPFGADNPVPAEINELHGVLSVVLKRFPTPHPDLPVKDLIAFKRDQETQVKFQRFWSWARKVAKQSGNSLEIEEELDSLLREYTVHLKQLHAETGSEEVEILMSTPGEVLEDILKLRFGNLARRLLQFRKAKVYANGRELGLPGNDIAYVIEATKLLSRTRQ